MKIVWCNPILRLILVGAWTIVACAILQTANAAQDVASQRDISAPISQGCGRQAPTAPLRHVVVSGRPRQVILVVPKGYDVSQPQRLVFAFHGRTNDNAKVRGYYDLERHAAPSTLFVYPLGLKDQNGHFTWSSSRERAHALRDYAFFDVLLAEIGRRYCVALNHIYIVGHSMGAWFGNSLACARASQIRAVATLGGGISASACDGSVAAMIIHNPKDRLVPFASGQRARDAFLQHNGLLQARAAPLATHPLNCRRYGSLTVRHPVLWCPHERDYTWRGKYYPHNWPRMTGQAIIAFFATLPQVGDIPDRRR